MVIKCARLSSALERTIIYITSLHFSLLYVCFVTHADFTITTYSAYMMVVKTCLVPDFK